MYLDLTHSDNIAYQYSSPFAGHTTAAHTSTILLSSRSNSAAITACSKLSESLLLTNGTFFSSDTNHLIQFLALNGDASPTQKYWVRSTDSTSKNICTAVSTKGLSSMDCDVSLPVFCSNSAPNKISGQTDLSPEFQVQVSSGNMTFTGYDFLFSAPPSHFHCISCTDDVYTHM